jgi:Mrp family chromosome partitioning ATPase
VSSPSGGPPALEVITSGDQTPDPARALSGDAIQELLHYVRGRGYDYVLIDAPPMLGIADVQGLIPQADHTIIVSRLDRVSLENVSDMLDLLERLQVKPMGLVVIGARTAVSPYYLSDRPAIFTAESTEPQATSGRSDA